MYTTSAADRIFKRPKNQLFFCGGVGILRGNHYVIIEIGPSVFCDL
jgi:hypothetical protein